MLGRRCALLGILYASGLLKQVLAGDGLRIGGTGSPLAALRSLSAGHSRTNARSLITVLPSLGSTGGIRALQAGVVDLAVSARPLTEVERSGGLRETVFARTLLVFASHPDVQVSNISLVDAARIYAGELSTWPGGTLIRLIRRPPTEADWQSLNALSPAMARAAALAAQRPGLLTAATDQDNVETIETVPGAFGLATLGQIVAEHSSIRRLSLDGVEPSLAALTGGRWPLSREFRLVTRSAPTSDVQDFIAYVHSPEGAVLLNSLAYLPVTGTR